MIALRKLIIEHPDRIYYKKERYDYDDGISVFSIFRNLHTNKWIGVVLQEQNEELVITTTDSEIDKLLQFFNDRGYSDFPNHPYIMSALEEARLIRPITSAYAYRNARPDIPVNGRVWNVRDGDSGNRVYLVSFWNRIEQFNNFDGEIEECLKLSGVEDISECLFEFVGHNDKWFTYSEVTGKESVKPVKQDDEETIQKLLKIQHINPTAKNIIKNLRGAPINKLQSAADKLGIPVIKLKQLLGMDVAEGRIKENPDTIIINPSGTHFDADGVEYDDEDELPGAEYVNYDDHYHVVAVICIGNIQFGEEPLKLGWMAGNPYTEEVYINKKNIGKIYSNEDNVGETHGDLFDSIDNFAENNSIDFSYSRRTHSRLYEYGGNFYLSFWESSREAKKYSKQIKDVVEFYTKNNTKKVMVQFEEMSDHQFVSFDEAFKTKIRRTKSKEKAKLQQALHLMGAKEKAEFLKKLGAAGPNKIQKAADKFGMTAIELRQALGMDVAENSLGNLSFSDYHDPSIPYEAKPRISIVPHYGTMFEKFSRKHTKNLLMETHLQDLFHATGIHALLDILKSGEIKLSFSGGTPSDHTLNKGYPFWLSTMRQKYGNFARKGNYQVIIHLDGRMLSDNGYKIFPVDYWGWGPEHSEQEERIVSDKDHIKPLEKYIKGIHVYVDTKIKNPFVLEKYHEVDQLAQKINFPIYFYPPGTEPYFQSHRTKKSVKSLKDILPQPEWSADDLESKKFYSQLSSPERCDKDVQILRTFLDIYQGNPVDTTKYPGNSVMRWILYYSHDAFSQIYAQIHNLKQKHPPIFRELVDAMKKEKVKSMKDLIQIVIDREQKKNKS